MVLEADINVLTILLSTVIPILVGIVTKEFAAGGLKAVILMAFSGLTGVVNSMIENEGVLTSETLTAAVVAWVTAVATYYGFLKPSGISEKVNTATAAVGVGGKN